MQDITVKQVHKKLNENGYICDVPFASQVTSAMKSKPVSGAFLYGPAGTGKSYLPIMLSKVLNIEMYFFQCAPGTREDDLVLKMFPSEETKSGVEIKKSTVFRAAEASHDKMVMLVLDEWDKTRPTADGFFLDFLQYGRLSIPGTDINANLDNMVIFFTANDEREFHEALLRRFPKIDINPLSPSLVMSALRLTHDGHPHLGSVLSLYKKAVMSGMSKPATIQEIRQLLDAITFLGNGADWNSLVYQYVTKTPENHKLLKDAEGTQYSESNNLAKLNSDSYDGGAVKKVAVKKTAKSKFIMPKTVGVHVKTESIKEEALMPSDEEIYGVYEYTDDNYSRIAHAQMEVDEAGDSVDEVDDFKIVHGKLLRNRPYQLANLMRMIRNRKTSGELVFVDELCTFNELNFLPRWNMWVIRRYSKGEVVARLVRPGFTLDMRWTKEDGIVLISSADDFELVRQEFQDYQRPRRLVSRNISSPNYESLNLVINGDTGKYNGTLNIKKLIEHKGKIKYSVFMADGKFRRIKGIRHITGGVKSVSAKSNVCIYTGTGFKLVIADSYTTTRRNNVANIEITGNPELKVLRGLANLSDADENITYGSYIPVYYAVKVNADKISKHLRKRGWEASRRTRGALRKYYESVDEYCNAYLLDNVVVFGFRFELVDDAGFHRGKDRLRFNTMRQTVKRLAQSAIEHG